MHVSGAIDQSESENYMMIRSGDDTSPGSSQFALAHESETHADTRVMSPTPNDGILPGIIIP